MLEVGTVLNDRYEIREKIGAGGMSIVYKAKCRKLQRYVAIKVLRDEFDKDEAFVKSFRAEALAAARLSHPNIVGIYDVGSDLGNNYIVMEYVEGKTLKELIEQGAPFSTEKVLEYGISLLSAIRHAHIKKIIHRDIKPQNILITNDHILKVTDFGIARAVDSSTLVSTGTAIGSVHYFSPEQARGKYVDETSDLYSCGIVLFELATGRLPFEADSHVSVALMHINEDLPMPTGVNKSIPVALENIILKATQKRPDLRYQSSEEMLQDLVQLSTNPAYQVNGTVQDMNQATILMTDKDAEFIKNNAKPEDAPTIPAVESQAEDQVEEEEEEATTAYTIMVTLAGILAAIVLIGIVAAFALPWFGNAKKPKVVVVPNIIKTQIEDARNQLKDSGLDIKIVDEEEMEGIQTGEILKQAPTRDQLVPLGTVIEVIIGKELKVILPEKSVVPMIEGMDFAEAQAELLDLELMMQITDRRFDDEIENGMIISQNPMSGNKLEKGSIVSVIVSKGKEIKTIKVPNIVNVDEKTAISMLTNLGLKVGSIDREDSETVDKGKVIRQGVPEGRDIEPSISVSIVVSKGPKPAPEPEPEPEPEEKPEPPKEVIKTKNLTITIPSFLEEKENYQVFIRLVSENGDTNTIYQGQVNFSQFPLTVPIKGKGKGTVETYIDNDPVYADPIDFSEVG